MENIKMQKGLNKVLASVLTIGYISVGYNIIFTFCGCTYLVVWLIIMLLIKRSENIKIETII